MYCTTIRRAASLTTKPLNLQEANAALLPPKPYAPNAFASKYHGIDKVYIYRLFRQILRSHRNLPAEMRFLGDDYVKAEFRRHKAVTNPIHIIGFLSQWKLYLQALPVSEGTQKSFAGQKLDPGLLEKMSPEQLGQLYELMNATKEVWSDSDSGGSESEERKASGKP